MREALVSAAILMTFAGLSLCAQVPLQSGIAEVNGTKLYYEMAGSGHAMVLLHGGAVDSRAWDDQFAEFATHYRVIRYDLKRGRKVSEPEQTVFQFRRPTRSLAVFEGG